MRRRCLSRSIFVLALALFAWPMPANAFWQRSHIGACKGARDAAEWNRLQCWIFAPVYEWPIPEARVDARYRGYSAPRWRK